MVSDQRLTSALIRIISLQGRAAVEAVLTGQFTIISNGTGKLVSTSVGGKSFSFGIDSKLNASDLISVCGEALQLWDSMDATARTRFLTARPIRKSVATF